MANHFLCLIMWFEKASHLVGFVKNFTSPELAGKMSTQEYNRKAVRYCFSSARRSRSIVRITSIAIARRRSTSLPSGDAR